MTPNHTSDDGLAETLKLLDAYPILGTQMLYFLDPVLRARADVAAPTEFYQIEGDTAVPQKAIDKTPNRISKPEVVPPDTTPLTEGERGFVEELELELGD